MVEQVWDRYDETVLSIELKPVFTGSAMLRLCNLQYSRRAGHFLRIRIFRTAIVTCMAG
jgi:hypothetical protein